MTEHATPDHAERAHAVLSASGADRWLNCPGSVALTQSALDSVLPFRFRSRRTRSSAEGVSMPLSLAMRFSMSR